MLRQGLAGLRVLELGLACVERQPERPSSKLNLLQAPSFRVPDWAGPGQPEGFERWDEPQANGLETRVRTLVCT